MIFRRLYEKLPEGNTNGMKLVNFFSALYPSVNPLIYLLPIDHKLLTKVFFDGLLPSMNLSIKYLSTKCEYKY
jgi:hypothetical protein